MYSRQQASELRQAFWTTFGQYMAPVPSAEGERINWINYRTGEKGIRFHMEAESRKASVGIELTLPDPGVRLLYFEQLLRWQDRLEAETGEKWTWLPEDLTADGKEISRVFTELPNRSVFRKEDWPVLISFFKARMQALDRFWSEAKYSFEDLR
ncbi:MAG TPA: DUF4268 domain-containing protein [Chitinophagaceae bacterium]|jgi:hypothetical protein|nr:DUF4268 domain-containing protein [Chitinophagaceae bacterium]